MHTPSLTWLRDVTGVHSYRQIGEAIGKSQTTVMRWARNGIPLDAIVRICVDYRRDLLDTLVELGMLAAQDRRHLTRNLDTVPTRRLTAEVHRRVLEHDRKKRAQAPRIATASPP